MNFTYKYLTDNSIVGKAFLAAFTIPVAAVATVVAVVAVAMGLGAVNCVSNVVAFYAKYRLGQIPKSLIKTPNYLPYVIMAFFFYFRKALQKKGAA